MPHPYRIVLTDDQRAELRTLIGSGVAPARMLTRARILLKADHADAGPGWSDAMIARALNPGFLAPWRTFASWMRRYGRKRPASR